MQNKDIKLTYTVTKNPAKIKSCKMVLWKIHKCHSVPKKIYMNHECHNHLYNIINKQNVRY